MELVLEDDDEEKGIEIQENIEVQEKAPNSDDKEEDDFENTEYEEAWKCKIGFSRIKKRLDRYDPPHWRDPDLLFCDFGPFFNFTVIIH